MYRKNTVRIIAGQYRRYLLRFPFCEGLRPTPDRTRETLFNWLGSLAHLRCLDLFAGSGALGFEAASRGANYVLMVEHDPLIAQTLIHHKNQLQAEQVSVLLSDANTYLSECCEYFDVIFLDPPFSKNMLSNLLDKVSRHLTEQGLVYVEAACLPSNLTAWSLLRYGKSHHTQYALLKAVNPSAK
jgi:16S rRNA (guanine966-N2)-methyltransferase